MQLGRKTGVRPDPVRAQIPIVNDPNMVRMRREKHENQDTKYLEILTMINL
jgi:hypothetical protein